MVCSRCGALLKPHYKYCPQCGIRVLSDTVPAAPGKAPSLCPETPAEAPVSRAAAGGTVPTPVAEEPAASSLPETSPKPKRDRRKLRRTAILALAAVLLVGAMAFGVNRSFPLRVAVDPGTRDLHNVTGMLQDLEIGVSSNQIITGVSYALNPDRSADYVPLTLQGGLFRRRVTIGRLFVPEGENDLYLRVKTLFGTMDRIIPVGFSIGSAAAPLQETLVPLEEGLALQTGELILVFTPEATDQQKKALVAAYEGEIVGQNLLLGEYQVRFSGSGEEFIRELRDRLSQEALVQDVFLDLSLELQGQAVPNDSEYGPWDVGLPEGNNWGLEAMDAPGAWNYADRLKTVRVGVIDGILFYDHPDLQIPSNRVHALATADFSSMEELLAYYRRTEESHRCPTDGSVCVYCSHKNHGTHCTGILGAIPDNSRGVAGVSWNAETYFCSNWYYSLDESGNLTCTQTASGLIHNLTWLVANGCRVISISVGADDVSEPSPYEEELTRRLDRCVETLEGMGYDFLLCLAAGNNDADPLQNRLVRSFAGGEHTAARLLVVASARNFTADVVNLRTGDHLLHPVGVVAAPVRQTAQDSGGSMVYNLDALSNYGGAVDLAAPGARIYSTVYDGYGVMSGTSAAAPMAAGVAAMVYGADGDLDAATVKHILCATWTDYAEKNYTCCGLVSARAAVELALDRRRELPERTLPQVGYVTGLVQDAATREPIYSAGVFVTDQADPEKTYSAGLNDSGFYELVLEPGTYRMEFSAAGYLTETVYDVAVTEGAVSYNVLLNLVPVLTETADPTGVARGRILNAFDAASISNATVEVFPGINHLEGEPLTTVRSDAGGQYELRLDPGNYTIRVTADGFAMGTAGVLVLQGTATYNQDCPLTPILQEGQMRIVLTWGSAPSDLDSHLVGPAPNGGRFHVFYSYKDYTWEGVRHAMLDVDDTSSYGPETISVYVSLEGTYTYCVQDFSNKGSGESTALSTSGAQVTLYVAGEERPMVFNVPNQPGTVWTVFSVTDGVVTPVNAMGFQSDPERVGAE